MRKGLRSSTTNNLHPTPGLNDGAIKVNHQLCGVVDDFVDVGTVMGVIEGQDAIEHPTVINITNSAIGADRSRGEMCRVTLCLNAREDADRRVRVFFFTHFAIPFCIGGTLRKQIKLNL